MPWRPSSARIGDAPWPLPCRPSRGSPPCSYAFDALPPTAPYHHVPDAARDTWLDVLKQVGYGETEVFELPAFTPAPSEVCTNAKHLP